MWWRLQRGQPLHRARIRKAVGSHPAIGPGLPGRPLDRVVAIRAFLPVRIEVSVRRIAAAHVLHDDRIAARHGLLVNAVAARRAMFPVRRTKDEHREPAGARGAIDIRPQYDAVAHGDCDVAFNQQAPCRLASHGRGDCQGEHEPTEKALHSLDSAATSARSEVRTFPTSNPFADAVIRVSAAAIGIAGLVSPGLARWNRTGLMRATTNARRYGDLKPRASSDLMIFRTCVSMSRKREA